MKFYKPKKEEKFTIRILAEAPAPLYHGFPRPPVTECLFSKYNFPRIYEIPVKDMKTGEFKMLHIKETVLRNMLRFMESGVLWQLIWSYPWMWSVAFFDDNKGIATQP